MADLAAARLLLLAVALCLPACAVSNNIVCEEPRREVCTKEFRPVCATRDNGVRCITTPCDSTEQATYPNACLACADPDVYHYEPGPCADDGDR